eukprot:CAMPEP_0202383708 /NCGR_PEP_ID=MMETSP1127-20130417/50795_1 /ASSEMBLY_ACC=CAM_ASM_000462 /TAXON_ID=3047 /ORGANISM="Dunaliella tertiolecta, Strain CCMP1320" /LENGTH=702 /DNA_ID=CAMNT_0048983277 /DNA_START=50 /DNA_END=2155 /DNA_ORIENTATION=-
MPGAQEDERPSGALTDGAQAAGMNGYGLKRKENGTTPSSKSHKKEKRGHAQNSAAVGSDIWHKIQEDRRQLPAWSCKEKLLELVRENQALVLVGETGSGKTTQIPQFLLKGGLAKGGAIACTQPRRVAAVTVAQRVAQELGTDLGGKVGYSIRFEDTTSPDTRIKYMTDGMLLREAMIDPLLSKYKVIIIDEAHERTVGTDVLLGLVKEVLKRRPHDVRLVVMSATLEASKFISYFPGCKGALIHGRAFPVQLYYTARPEDNYLDAALNATLQIHTQEGPGDILVFLTGQDEIESLERLLQDRISAMQLARSKAIAAEQLPEEDQENSSQKPEELLVYTIYAAMPHEQQLRAFEPAPPGARKVILATNIAETSITISGVRYVVDPGFVKARVHNPRLGADALQVVPVSQAQAQQRSGRAGREGPGKAYRLYTEQAFDSLELATVPEILRSNLASVVLQLKALGINDVLGFDFLDKPPIPSIVRSLELLYSLGALDSQGKLTSPVGTSLSRLPVDPMYGKVLLAATGMGCSIEAMQVISMVSTDGVFVVPRAKREEANAARLKFTSKDGDHLTLLAVARAFAELSPKQQTSWCHDNFINIRSLRKAQDIYQQLARQLHQLQLPLTSCGEDPTSLRRALVAGLFPQSARKQPDGTYKVIATGQQVFIHPSSVLIGKKVDCIVFSELVLTTKQYARDVTSVDARW